VRAYVPCGPRDAVLNHRRAKTVRSAGGRREDYAGAGRGFHAAGLPS
jgi:hypothetical protein